MNYTELIKNTWGVVNKYFHKDYQQCINGVSMKRDEFFDAPLCRLHQQTDNYIDTWIY